MCWQYEGARAENHGALFRFQQCHPNSPHRAFQTNSVYQGKGTKKKKDRKSMVFNHTGGARGIILGPSKHVLHLVCSAFVISTAISTALKVDLRAWILENVGQNQWTKE